MDREEWIRNYGSKGLKGDILVRVSYTDDNKEYWVSNFLEIKNLPVYNLALIDKELISEKDFKDDSELKKIDNYLKEKYKDCLKTESVYFLIDPGTKFLKKCTSDKDLCLFYEIKFDSEINLRDLDNTKIISENIRISKNKLKDFMIDLTFELAGEAGLFYDQDYSPSLYTKLCYFNILNIFRCLEQIPEYTTSKPYI